MVQNQTQTQTKRADGNERKSRAAALATAVLLVTASANAAEITDVRVGHHPDYTRIVFQLDGKAGHRIERNEQKR